MAVVTKTTTPTKTVTGVAAVTPPVVPKVAPPAVMSLADATEKAKAEYGNNVAGFDASDINKKGLADIGLEYAIGKYTGDTARMNAAAAAGQQYRAGLGTQNTFNAPKGITTFGSPGYGETEAKNEINAQIEALRAQQASQKSALDYQTGLNNQYLSEQLEGLGQAEAVAGDSAQQLQNRRGGFYSGGLDYQMGGIQREYAGARSALSRDIATRNQQLLDQYGTQANQIASQIQQLQTTAPQIIRDRITEYKQREAVLTGDYNGARTLAGQAQDNSNMQTMATLTGVLPNGQKTTAQQQTELGNLWQVADSTGVIPNALADMYGIKRGTPTQSAKEFALNYALDQRMTNANIANMQADNARLSAGGGSSGGGANGTIVDLNMPTTVASMVTFIKNKLPGVSNSIQGPADPNRNRSIESLILSNPNLSDKQITELYNKYGIPVPK